MKRTRTNESSTTKSTKKIKPNDIDQIIVHRYLGDVSTIHDEIVQLLQTCLVFVEDRLLVNSSLHSEYYQDFHSYYSRNSEGFNDWFPDYLKTILLSDNAVRDVRQQFKEGYLEELFQAEISQRCLEWYELINTTMWHRYTAEDCDTG